MTGHFDNDTHLNKIQGLEQNIQLCEENNGRTRSRVSLLEQQLSMERSRVRNTEEKAMDDAKVLMDSTEKGNSIY